MLSRRRRRRLGLPLIWLCCVSVATLVNRVVEATTVTLPPAPTVTPTPTLAGGLGRHTLGGVVYDLSIGRRAVIANAEVVYLQGSTIFDDTRGSTFTSQEGRYQFEVELGDTDQIAVAVNAPGYNAAGLSFGGLHARQYSSRLDVGLEPATRSEAAPACAGDCGRQGSVTVVDLVNLINVGLGAPVEHCEPGDVDRDGMVTVDEVTLAVGNALEGCVLATPDFSVVEVRTDGSQDCSSPTMFVCLRNDGSATDRIVRVDVESSGLMLAKFFDVLGIGAEEVRCFERPFQSFATVKVDPTNQIEELDEANNVLAVSALTLECLPTPSATASPTATGSLVAETPTPTQPTLTPTPPRAPNLIVYSVTVDSVVGSSSCIFDVPNYPRLQVCVRNVGNAAAGPSSISVGGEDVLRTEQLFAGDFFCRSTPFLADGSVVADSGNEVDESNEDDNAVQFSLVRPTPPATCTPVRTPTPTATERHFYCCQDVSGCHQPPFNGICFTGIGYEAPAFCNAESGQCENIPPTRTPTPTRNPTQPPPDLVPVSADLYAPLLVSCGRGNPIGGFYCVTNRGGDVSTSFVLRLVTELAERDFASFGGIRAGEQLCVVGPHERFAQLVVDPYDSIAESDESNNRLSFSLAIPTYPPDCSPTPTPASTATP